MRPAFAKASGVFLAVLAAVLAWLLVTAASLAGAGGPNPLYLRAPQPVSPSSGSSLTGTVVLIAALLAAALAFALLQRRADRRAIVPEVTEIGARQDDDQSRKAA
jgi:hypothetical protein